MGFDWSTFLLETANFLILVWILKRFLYAPVLGVIRARKAAVDRIAAEAEATRAESLALKESHERALQEWEREKEGARGLLQEELAAERNRLLAELREELEREREKAAVLGERRRQEELESLEQEAVRQGAGFAARLLARLASPALEARIVSAALEDLAAMPPEVAAVIGRGLREGVGGIAVTSAYPLDPQQRELLAARLAELAGATPRLEFREDPALVSGLRIGAGPWVFRANLADELDAFMRAAGRVS